MNTRQIDPLETQRYFDLLYPDAPDDASLVVSWRRPRDREAPWHHQWVRCADVQNLARGITQNAPRAEIYIGLGLRHPNCTPQQDKRGKSEDVYALPGLWIELDHSAGVHAEKVKLPTPEELLALIEALPFRFSLIVDSNGGYHCYALFKELWILDTEDERESAALLLRRFQRTIQAQAAEHGWKVDSTADLARVLRPAGTLNHKGDTPKPVTILHEDGIRYTPYDIDNADWLATIEDIYTAPSTGNGDFPPTVLESIVAGCGWLRHCRDDARTLPEPEWYGMLGIVGRCEHGEQIAHDWSTPYPRYSKDETTKKLQHALKAAGPLTCSTIRYDKGGDEYCRGCQHWGKVKSPIVLGMLHTPVQDAQRRRNGSATEEDRVQTAPEAHALPWPQMAPEAFHGLLGEIVRTIEPHTEADPAAILLQFLAMFGNLVNRAPYTSVEADRHYLNLFVCLVGETSKGRKGVSAGYPKRLLEMVDDVWAKSRMMSGLSSGEGLIWYARDPIYKQGKDGTEECMDEGEPDKRLLVVEPEFARVLRVLARDGNTLSAIIRHAWDDGTLQTMVSGRRVASVKATEAHISIIGHITVDELRRNLTETETSNGFANRFLWCCVRRSKLLPEGGMYPQEALAPLAHQLKTAVVAARKTGRMQRDEATRARWAGLYEQLSEGKPGLVGHVTARAEAQVLRLSCLYALLDQSPIVQVSHLDAALALWRYCEASARYIFGDALGDALADEILQMLRDAAPEGLTRTDIYNAFGRNKKSTTIHQALAGLWRHQLATSTKEATEGRPVERWYARLSSSASTQKTHLTQKGQEQTTLNAFNTFNASTQGDRADYEEGVI